MPAPGQMKATIVADFSQFERGARAVASSASIMGRQVSQAMEGAKGATQANAQAFDALRASVDPAFAASQRYAALQRQVASLVDAGAASQRTANLVLEQAAKQYLGVATASERAQQAQRQGSIVADQAAHKYHALRASLDPLYAASKQYEMAQETLSAAVTAGAVSQMQANRVLAMAEAQFLGAGRGAAHAGAATGKFGLIANQLSFQIQDVFVQGPMMGWFRAIAQQAPQAAGAFAMMGGKIGLLVPILGTLVAVGAALIPIFMSGANAAENLSKRVDELSGSVGSFDKYADLAHGSSSALFAEFGVGAGRARELYSALMTLEAIKFDQNLTASVEALKVSLGGISDAIAEWDYAGTLPDALRAEAIDLAAQATRRLGDAYGLTRIQAREVVNAMNSLSAAKGPEQAAIASKALVDALIRAKDAGAQLPPELISAAAAAAEVGIGAEKMRAMLGLGAQEAAGLRAPLSDSEVLIAGIFSSANSAVSALGLASGETWNWASAMSGVRAELYGILSAISQIGGGVISRASKMVELNALRAGRSVADARVEVERFNAAAQWDAKITAASGHGGVLGWAERKALEAGKALDLANMSLDETLDAERKASAESERLSRKKGAAGADAAKKLAKELDREKEKWIDLIDPLARYRRELEELGRLKGHLTADQMTKATEKLNLQLAESMPLVNGLGDAWAQFIVSGGKDISAFGDLFKQTLQQMLADAAKTRLMVWLGIGQSGSVPTAGQQGGAGGLSGLGNLISPDSWLGKGLSSGKGFLGGIGNLLGFGGAGAAGGGAMAGLAGFLGAAGTILGGIGAAIAIGKALFGRTLKDVGVQGSFTGDNFSGQSYKFYKGGLLRSDKTKTQALDSATAAIIGTAYADLRENIRDMAGVLGLGTDAIKDFAHDFKISTKDMSQDQIVQALQEEMAKAGAGMAEIVLGTARFTKAGESALDAMTRLSSSLSGMRDVADLLGHRFVWAGLRGADLASGVVDAFGGMDQMGSAVQAYWQTFYGENARLRTVTRQTRDTLADLGSAMPRTRDEYRRMIEAIDLSDRSSHELYATLIGLSGVMDQILPAASGLTRQLERMQDRLSLQLGRVSEGLTEAISLNRAAAGDWGRASETIRDYLDKLRGTASALVTRQAALAYNRVMYLGALRDAQGGNSEAAQGLTGRAQDYLSSVIGSASTAFGAAQAQARIMAQIGGVADTSDRYGAALDRAADLQGRQLAAIERLQQFIANGGTLTAERLVAVRERIAALDGSISLVSRANADLTIAGFNDALTANPVQIEGGMALREAMGGLRGSLRDLKRAVVAETGRQERESRIAALNRYVSGLTVNGKGHAFVDDAQIARMAEIAGINTAGLTTGQIRNRLVGFSDTDKLTGTVYDPTGSREAAYLDRKNATAEGATGINDPLMGYRLGYSWRGSESGETHQIVHGPLGGARSFDVAEGTERTSWLKKMVEGGRLPAFDAGGYHSGGLRMVGESGAELEVTGPARYYNARQTQQMLSGGSPEMLAELRAMRRALEQLQSDHRQLALKTEQNTHEIARFARAADRRALAEES